MNGFMSYHQDQIRFHYSCFDRILLNVCVQLLQIPVNVVCFFRDQRRQTLERHTFRAISRQYHDWVVDYAQQQRIPIWKSVSPADGWS